MGEIGFGAVYILGVIISSIAQIILKKSAGKKYSSRIREYFNLRVIFSYGILLVATFCTIFAYKKIPLSLGPILGATEYIFVAILCGLFLKERISTKKVIGLIIIVIGVAIFSLNTIAPPFVDACEAYFVDIFS